MKHSMLSVVIISVFLILVTGCRGTVPVYNIENSPVAAVSDQDVSLDKVGEAIKRAGVKRGWIMKQDGEGHIVGILSVRKHVAKVDITYDAKSYSINYKDSEELNYKEGEIHPKFNSWVENLQRDINLQLNRL
ncbi:MAG: hypothetical protein L3J98_07015 [Gammaproteobacteria bacterium]|nr:hypothetical protein [Gammaproteobacteria bacterium]MCF6259896.1 hypothetical protein [Gammaproteobacteria bacterium]